MAHFAGAQSSIEAKVKQRDEPKHLFLAALGLQQLLLVVLLNAVRVESSSSTVTALGSL